MKFALLHGWPTRPAAAIALQKALADRVRLESIRGRVRLMAGADVAFSPDGRETIAGVVLWDADRREVCEQVIARRRCRFPYVPGLLSFRELPGVLAAFRRLKGRPDVVLADAQGLAHPRRFGLACHLGLWLGVPTVGCAKSRLCGEHRMPGPKRGDRAPLMLDGRRVGTVLRTRDGVRPLFISPGHLCDQASAVRMVLRAGGGVRLPEPARCAHRLVTTARQSPKISD